MKLRGDNPEDHFPIPPNAPEEVQTAYANFERVAAEWRAAKALVRELPGQAKTAIGHTHLASAKARVSGGAPPKKEPSGVATEYEHKLVQARSDLAVLATALHDVGNGLADAIEANKALWVAQLDIAEHNASLLLQAALREAREALADLGPARQGPRFLRDFDVHEAKRGEAGGFVATDNLRLDVPHLQRERGVRLDSQTRPGTLLDLLELVADPPPPTPTTRILKRAKDSSMMHKPTLTSKSPFTNPLAG